MLAAVTRHFPLAADVNLAAVAAALPGTLSGADTAAVCSAALGAAIRRKTAELAREVAAANEASAYEAPVTLEAFLRRLRGDPARLAPTVTMADFAAAAVAVSPSVSPAELRHYEELKLRFCSAPDDSDGGDDAPP